MVGLSVVLGTCDRFSRLRSCVESIEKHVSTPFEIVIADGGSVDGSREWAVTHPKITLIGERSLNGAVDAYNKAFSICRGKFVAHINDDCELTGGCIDAACQMLRDDAEIGQVAIPYSDPGQPPIVNYIHVKKVPILYANFGVTRRALGDAVGWWGDYLYTYGGDCELSFRIWEAGYRVEKLSGFHIRHHRERDGLRIDNTESRAFFSKWATFNPFEEAAGG